MPLNHSSKYANLTDHQYTLIGKIVVEFSNLEFLLGSLLNKLLLTPEYLGRSYTDTMNISTIQESIKNALEIHKIRYNFKIVNEGQSQEIKILNDRISQIRAIRNTFAHYKWVRKTDDEISGFKLSGKLPNYKNPNRDSKSFSNSDLETLYKEVYSIVDKLSDLVFSLPEFKEDENLLNKLTFKL